jgi:hypothetical protein
LITLVPAALVVLANERAGGSTFGLAVAGDLGPGTREGVADIVINPTQHFEVEPPESIDLSRRQDPDVIFSRFQQSPSD